MPTYFSTKENHGEGKPGNDLFPRLSVAMCDDDDGTRPVNPAWLGSDKGWLSPAISFDVFPIIEKAANTLKVSIKNFGTMVKHLKKLCLT